ncbi:putative exported protein [Lysobacter capsici AZ78]|uniref:Exported protein n=2 Tax=Lysobacter capsici TaxID=435897 RepID=A0A108UBQ3_9GAMM|nr:putative exported protein [Lysobacter capsici AZ78]
MGTAASRNLAVIARRHGGAASAFVRCAAAPRSGASVAMRIAAACLGAALLLPVCAVARTATAAPATGVIGIEEGQLNADYWIRQQTKPDATILDPRAIAAQNQRLHELDPSVHDIEHLPARLTQAQVREWIEAMSQPREETLYDERGEDIPAATLAALSDNLALDAIPASQATRYGMVVRRADLRTFPTRLRVFNAKGDSDIDRFQESALFPGTPVAIVHASQDGKYWFVVSPLYAAWVEKDRIAEGAKAAIFDYTRKTPYLVVTGASARTVHTPEQPGVSDVQLEMGVRVPLLADWPSDKPVNGQHHYASHVIELPYRDDQGRLRFSPALLPRTADTSADYLPLTQANLVRQGFKFFGERYGWGHSYNTRDCSGFVSEIYRSFGVQLPRNTRDQAVSPAYNRIDLAEGLSHDERLKIVKRLEVGDLIYIPGHVMMVVGHEDGWPYVIHDTTGITFRDRTGELARVHLNGVSVTPLVPLLFNREQPTVDRITSIQRIRP